MYTLITPTLSHITHIRMHERERERECKDERESVFETHIKLLESMRTWIDSASALQELRAGAHGIFLGLLASS